MWVVRDQVDFRSNDGMAAPSLIFRSCGRKEVECLVVQTGSRVVTSALELVFSLFPMSPVSPSVFALSSSSPELGRLLIALRSFRSVGLGGGDCVTRADAIARDQQRDWATGSEGWSGEEEDDTGEDGGGDGSGSGTRWCSAQRVVDVKDGWRVETGR
jgi:hypothetical protein